MAEIAFALPERRAERMTLQEREEALRSHGWRGEPVMIDLEGASRSWIFSWTPMPSEPIDWPPGAWRG